MLNNTYIHVMISCCVNLAPMANDVMMIPTAKILVKMNTLFLSGFHYFLVTSLRIQAKFMCPSKKSWVTRITKTGLISPSTYFFFISGSSPMKRRAVVVKIGIV